MNSRGFPVVHIVIALAWLLAPAAGYTAENGAGEATWPQKLERNHRITKPVTGTLFTTKSWAVPVKPPPAPAPTVPKFPYTYIGKIEQSGKKPMVILTREGRVYKVSVGSLLGDIYRVDAIANDDMKVTYLPLKKILMIAYAEIAAKETRGTTGMVSSIAPQSQPSGAIESPRSPTSPEPAQARAQAESRLGGGSDISSSPRPKTVFGISTPSATVPTPTNSDEPSSVSRPGTYVVPGGTMAMIPPAKDASLPMTPPVSRLPVVSNISEPPPMLTPTNDPPQSVAPPATK